MIRHGGFLARKPLPPTRGLGKGLPRYAYYIESADIPAHLARLDRAGAQRSEPIRTSADGDPGTVIYWQDPDGNQFEFWAPDALPDGAMHGGCRTRRAPESWCVRSRDLARTATFFAKYCTLDPEHNAMIGADRLVLRLAAGGRMIFRQVDALEGRTTGCGLRDAHTALVVRDEDFFPNYARVFAGLPEWDFDAVSGVIKEPPEELLRLPARTALHPSGGGRKFKAATTRGDDFFDWDTNMFHFFGAKPIGGSYAVYEALTVEDQIASWEREHGDLDSLKAMVNSKVEQNFDATALRILQGKGLNDD